MLPPIEAVLFDYGLVLSSPPDPAAWAIMLTTLGFEQTTLDHAYWTPRHDYDRGALTGEQYWHEVARIGGRTLDQTQLTALLAADTALWTQPNEPMVAWAARLQNAGIRTGILSNIGDAIAFGITNKFAWLDGFHHRIWSHTLGMAKPDPAIYRHAAEGLGLPPERILFVDDREDNIAGGAAAGMQVIRYTRQTEFEQEMDERGLGWLWAATSLPIT